MSDSKTIYQQILKSTALFGGVQVFNIIVSIVRSKAIAIFIGPSGMGIAGLLTSTINVLYSATSFGLDTSGVKYIAQANSSSDKKEVSKIVSVLKQLMWYTGVLGSLLTMIFASSLSKFTFNSEEYTWSFVWIACTLLFKNIANSNYAALQGLGRLKDLAKANFYGSFLGLILTLPFYYYMGKEAIVPAIISSSFIAMITALFFSNKLNLATAIISKRKLFSEGRGLIHLGVMLSMSGLMTTAAAYALQIYISQHAGIEVVGYYVAAFTLLNSYVGIIFTSMSTDYYPRLSAVAHDEGNVRTLVTHQAYIALLIITPLICLFIPFAPLIIKLLYSSKFITISSMITYGILGMLFRAVSWSMGFILIAKGDSKIFIKTSFFFNALFLGMNILAFHFWGLDGLGISFALYYLLHLIILKVITLKIYNFYFDKDFYKIFISSSILCLSVLIVNHFELTLLSIFVLIILGITSILFSIFHLNKKVDFIKVFKKLKK